MSRVYLRRLESKAFRAELKVSEAKAFWFSIAKLCRCLRVSQSVEREILVI